MLTLTLFRHAKSSWELNGLDDRERPLNARGSSAAPLMAGFMHDHRIRPEFVLCSTAVRTRQTPSTPFTVTGNTDRSAPTAGRPARRR